MSQDRRPRRLAVVAGMAAAANQPRPAAAADVVDQTASVAGKAKRTRPALIWLVFIAACAGGGGLGAILLGHGFAR